MCVVLSGHAGYCTCVRRLPDKTLVRLCDVAMMNNKTPCKMVSFPPPGESLVNSVCPRCSSATGITIFINPSVRRRTPNGRSQECYTGDGRTELQAQLNPAIPAKTPSVSSPSCVDDTTLIESLKDATNFAMVEHEDGEEQSDEEGAPPPTLDSDEGIHNFVGQNCSPTKLGKMFGTSLGRLFLGK
jgi:hypothetical protein